MFLIWNLKNTINMIILCIKISYESWINKLETTVFFRYIADMFCWYSIPTCFRHSPPTFPCYNRKRAKPGNYILSTLEFQLSSTIRSPPTFGRQKEMRSHLMLLQQLRVHMHLWQKEVMRFSSVMCPHQGAP